MKPGTDNLKLKLIAFLLLFQSFSFGSYAQFSIRKNAGNTSAVDILYKAPVSGQGVHPVQFFEFSLQIPNPKGATLTAGWAPAAPLAALAGFQAYTGTDYGNTTFAWASTGVPNYGNTYNFPGTEVVLGTVTFSSAANATGAIVSAIDYQNQSTYGGPGTGVAVWTMQVDPTGTDVTNYSSLFYQSVASGGVAGSSAPATTNDGGMSNQKVSLSVTPLPVTLKDFTATANSCNVLLSWHTGSEQDFDRFDVAYSTDGSSYSKIGTVKSAHNSLGSSYTFTHEQPSGVGYYRLSMVDIDGSYTVSRVVTVRTDCNSAVSPVGWSIYPNPAQQGDKLHLQLVAGSDMKQAHIVITDLMGRILMEETYPVQEGVNVYALPLYSRASGTYMIHVCDEHGAPVAITQKLILR